ncbi:multidrug resistance efflux transporter family protein [Metaclostridioides mangenotii]|uniref:DMT family transporter n=1 Tax=Metaclostridioides mangenotii TaxID=1540 RepID=UPI0028EC0502|nr:multidrug resistance efflux transporter family protein [Clostridioides mangenotii]
MKKAIFYGIASSLFFAFTFVLNKSMNLSGGNWMWSASLRYIFMLPLLYIMLLKNRGIKNVLKSIKNTPRPWIIWSTIGFGLFYAPLTFASDYGQSWLVAGCWQLTIVAGILLTPMFGEKIPLKGLAMSFVILAGVFLIQYEQASDVDIKQIFSTIIPIVIAAFAYPLGNRKMMQICKDDLTTTERVFGMTLCSMPFWIVLACFALEKSGLPSINQVSQSFVIAIFSGLIATILFFKATELVKDNAHQLAIIEATQSGEVVFTLLGEVLILGGMLPALKGFAGLALIIVGMILNSLVASNSNKDVLADIESQNSATA